MTPKSWLSQCKPWPGSAWRAALCAALVLLAGCAAGVGAGQRTPVPGSNIYCISMSTDAGFRARIQTSNATYGTRKLGGLGTGSVCDLVQFETYVVTWQTRDGRQERFEFDFEKIMLDFQQRTPQVQSLTRHSSQPKLTLDYRESSIDISYRVSQFQEGGMEMRNGLQILTKPPVVTQFPLLTVPLAPAALAPDRK